MARKNPYRVVYSVKNENGYIVDKSKQFPTFIDAMTYVKLLKEGGNLVGKPVFEIAAQERAMTKRYNLQLNAWEVGYYQGTRFVVVKLEKIN